MGLDSSPNCCTPLLLTSSFSIILLLYLPLLVHLCAQIFSISYCYPTPSFFPALTFFPLFLFLSPLFYNFLPRLYFCHFLSLFSPISTTCLSFSSSLFLFLIDLTSLSLPLFPFSLMISLTTLNFLWFHLCAISGLASGNWRFYVTMLWCSWLPKGKDFGIISCAFGISCYGLQAVFNTVECSEFFVSRALAQSWNALAGQVQIVQFSDFAVLFTPHCVSHPEWFQIKI